MTPRRVRRAGTVMLSAALAVLGIVVVVEGILASISPFSGRFLIGLLMVAAGAGRLYVETRRGRGA